MNPTARPRILRGATIDLPPVGRDEPGRGGLAPVTPELVWRLMTARGYPLVSLLMPTVPAARMVPEDVARLRRLVDDAGGRLVGAAPSADLDAVSRRLGDLVAQAADLPTGDAVALYASAHHAQGVRLPLPVQERVVVDPTYATRDLVRVLHRTPRHVLLLLGAGEARLFEGVGGTLTPAADASFPLASDRPSRSEGRRQGAPDREFLRSVDRALTAYLGDHPAPLVLAGPPRVLATYRGMSRNLGRLAGTITGNRGNAPLTVLQERIRPVLDAYLHSRQDEALELLERRSRSGRVVSGIRAAWTSAGAERPEMLAVEDGLSLPGRLSDDGELVPTTDLHRHDVLDDAVDELIERVLVRGGWVALVDDGALSAHDGVALTVRG